MKIKSLLFILFCFVVSDYSYAADTFKVSINIFHKDKLLAQPEMNIKDGEDGKASVSLPGAAEYAYSLLVNSTADGKVNVSINFVSGKLIFKPELVGVDVGKETSASINDFKLKLLVEKSVREL